MRKQYFYIAGVAASALAVGLLGMPASGSVSGRPTPSMLHVVHQPVIDKKLVQTNSAPNGLPLFTSGNWAGYVALTGGSTKSYKEVQSDYTVPSVNCNSVGTGDGFAYHWVGLDGWNSGTVEQDGVAGFCEGGSASYDAWWEMFPNGINLVFSVSPGDAITSSVTYNGGGNYTLFLNDHTSGQSFSLSENCPTTCSNNSSEDITEGYESSPWLGTADYGKEFYNGFKTINQAGHAGGILSAAWPGAEVEAIGASSGLPTSVPGPLYSSAGNTVKSKSAFEVNWSRVN